MLRRAFEGLADAIDRFAFAVRAALAVDLGYDRGAVVADFDDAFFAVKCTDEALQEATRAKHWFRESSLSVQTRFPKRPLRVSLDHLYPLEAQRTTT